jgi:hypothetical protein
MSSSREPAPTTPLVGAPFTSTRSWSNRPSTCRSARLCPRAPIVMRSELRARMTLTASRPATITDRPNGKSSPPNQRAKKAGHTPSFIPPTQTTRPALRASATVEQPARARQIASRASASYTQRDGTQKSERQPRISRRALCISTIDYPGVRRLNQRRIVDRCSQRAARHRCAALEGGRRSSGHNIALRLRSRPGHNRSNASVTCRWPTVS